MSLYKFCGSETWVAAYLEGYELGSDDGESVQVSRSGAWLVVRLERYEFKFDNLEFEKTLRKQSLVEQAPGRVRAQV